MHSPSFPLWSCVQAVRQTSPLVHSITNLVVMHTTANALLAFGASPVMAHAPEEMKEMASIANALVLNIGTLTLPWVASMHIALATARARGIPVVLDPVGAGASNLRTITAIELMAAAAGATLIVRGNASEILTISGEPVTPKGVDSTAASSEATAAAIALAQEYGCTVCVSGETDVVTDGTDMAILTGGHELMTRVTGLGCAATALIGAVAGACPRENPLVSVAAAMAVMSTAGTMAFGASVGPGSFFPAFLDALYLMKEEDLGLVSLRLEDVPC